MEMRKIAGQYSWTDLAKKQETCLHHLQDVKNLLTLSSCQQQSDTRQQQSNARQQLLDAGQPQPDIGQQSSRQKQQQQRQQDSRNQKHKQTEETDKLITLIALNQKLYPDGFTDVETEIERKETSLRKKEIRILIAGEVATGKSTLMNVIMGGAFLPTDHFHCTAVLCELHLSIERKAIVYFRDKGETPITIQDLSNKPNEDTKADRNGTGWEQVWYYVKESPETPDILKVELFWPIPFIKVSTQQLRLSDRHSCRRKTEKSTSSSSPTQMKELKVPYGRSPGDGSSFSGSFNEGLAGSKVKSERLIIEGSSRFPSDSEETIPKVVDSRADHLPSSLIPEYKCVITEPALFSNKQDMDCNRIVNGTFTADEVPETVNIVMCDCPGITENEDSFSTTLEYVDSCQGIILMIDAFKNNAGIEEQKVLKLIQCIQERLRKFGFLLQTIPVLCICNKMEMLEGRTKQTVEETVKQSVAESFQTTQDIQVLFLGTKVLLENHTDSSQLTDDTGNQLTDQIEVFLKQSFLSSIQTQHLWMLKLLDLSLTIKKEQQRLTGCFRNLNDDKYREALALFEEVSDKQIEVGDAVSVLKMQMKTFLVNHEEDFEIDWTADEADRRTQQRHASWDVIKNEMDTVILRKLKDKVENDNKLLEFRSLRERYRTLQKDLFKAYQKKLDVIKKVFPTNFNSQQSYKDFVGPIATQAAVIGASRLVPHAMVISFAAPLLGLILFGYGLYEIYHDHKGEMHRAKFENDVNEYLKLRTKEMIKTVYLELNDEDLEIKNTIKQSDTYTVLFGESIKKNILDELSTIIQNYLAGNTLTAEMKRSQPKQNMSEGCILSMHTKFIEVYKSYAEFFSIEPIETSEIGQIDLECGEFVRRLVKQNGQSKYIIMKTCEAVESSSETGLKLKLCEELLCSLTSKNYHINMLSLKEARLLQYDGASPDLCLIFEDCETDLAKFVNDNPFRKDQEQRSEQKREFVEIGLQIAQAIYFLHSRYITHGNIKSEIILLKTSNNRKVIKLGSVGIPCHTSLFVDNCSHMPPELTAGQNTSPSERSDIYSVGLGLLELWFRVRVGNLKNKALEKIEDSHVKEIFCGCLQTDPTTRWFSKDLLEKFISVKRVSANDYRSDF